MTMFKPWGAHVLADGQYGSTGKGALAAYLAREAIRKGHEFRGVVSNAGPNSGHTFYHEGEKHVLKQLPTFAVASHLMGETIPVYLSAGAVINVEILNAELAKYPMIPVYVHRQATCLSMDDVRAEHSGSVAAVAGTRSGTGAAIARKVLRDPNAVYGSGPHPKANAGYYSEIDLAVHRWPYFVEISQGFSLGLNSRFYPKVTSRECTFAQGLADARIAPSLYSVGFLSFRTFPIRVGDVDGYNSGGWYPDQREVSWDSIGVEAERTTVTNRPRRIASWSWDQFTDAMRANRPEFVFINFLNYLIGPERRGFISDIQKSRAQYQNIGQNWDLIGGDGPESNDIGPHHFATLRS